MPQPILLDEAENEWLQNLLQTYVYGILRIQTPTEQQYHDSIMAKLQAADTP